MWEGPSVIHSRPLQGGRGRERHVFWVNLGNPHLSPCHFPRYKVRDWIVVSRFANGIRIPRGRGEGSYLLKIALLRGWVAATWVLQARQLILIPTPVWETPDQIISKGSFQP